MALSNYSELKSAVANWMARSDLTGDVPEFIQLAEASLNREIGPVEIDATLTGTAGSRNIDITSFNPVEAKALFLAEAGRAEEPVFRRREGSFSYQTDKGRPTIWTMNGPNTVTFDRLLDSAYPFRLRMTQRFALSDASPTNWLLQNHPDLYLAAAIVWGGVFVQNPSLAAGYKTLLDQRLREVRNVIGRNNRGELLVDPALARTAHRPSY